MGVVAILVALLASPALPIRPDPALTPGTTFPTATAREVCTPGYASKVRNVTSSRKQEVFDRYGLRRSGTEFEVDHLISLQLGGDNSTQNLWPQAYRTRPFNAIEKDKLENRLHWLVCHGRMSLRAAQHEIATDWIAAYRRYVAKH